jgi:VWFA-related protein
MKGGLGRRRLFTPVIGAMVLQLVSLVPVAAGGADEEAARSELPLQWKLWLDEEVYPLITKEQRQAFLALETEAQRRAFVERLWLLWGRQAGYGSAFRGMYMERLDIARVEFGNTIEDRARVLLIHGPPTGRQVMRCDSVFTPLEFWLWSYLEGLGEDVVVLFYRPNMLNEWRMWTTFDGYQRLYATGYEAQFGGGGFSGSVFDNPVYRCPNGDVIMRLLAAAAAWSNDPTYMSAMSHVRWAERGGAESTSRRFMEFSALLDKDAEPVGVAIASAHGSALGGLIEMSFAIDVDAADLGSTPVGDIEVVQLDVVGEITSGLEVMVDRFRYLFSVPHAGDRLGLAVDRLLRPGDYTLRLKVEDVHSKRGTIEEHRFTVDPALVVAREERGLEEADVEAAGLGAASPAPDAEAGEEPLLRLVGPEGDAVSGLCRFEALARDEVRKVSFLLDSEEVLTKNRPPFDIDLNLGPLPKLTTVTAIGYDSAGDEIARAGYTLNVGRERFFVRLAPVSAAGGQSGQVKVGVELNIPSDAHLERLELYWNDGLLATLFAPPFEALVDLRAGDEFGYLRALAILEDGAQAEDLQFVNQPRFGSVVRVTAVELPVTVLDNEGLPVTDLAVEDFTVYENKVVQAVTHFALHHDLPVRLGIVIDTSGSMTETLPTVQRVVMGFLRNLLRPRDRAFIAIFSDRPDLLTGFTANFTVIENALLALYADRATAFYDAVIMGLFQYSGVSGRRAMVVLTDGEDNASKNSFDDALGYAQRMGVTIYTIGVGIPQTKMATRWQLSKLASVTGGKAFFVTEKSGLDAIYAEIDRELRTQYLLAYTSSTEAPASELRRIKVEVNRPQVSVRTLAGYYPVGG